MKKLVFLLLITLSFVTAQAQEEPADTAEQEAVVAEEESAPELAAPVVEEVVVTTPETPAEVKEEKPVYRISKNGSCSTWDDEDPARDQKFDSYEACQASPLMDEVRMEIKLQDKKAQEERTAAYEKQQALKEAQSKAFDKWAKGKPPEYAMYKYFVLKGRVAVGMTEELVRKAIGEPERVTVSKGNVKQMVYPKQDYKYVYITKGKVESFGN